MRKLTMVGLVLAMAAVIAACSSSGSTLTGKTWQLIELNESTTSGIHGAVPSSQQANYTIEFKSDGSYTAKVDCNTVSGTYTTTASGGMTIVLGPTTLVACPNAAWADVSNRYITALGSAASYAIADSQLTITTKDGRTLVYK
jgi:heat shock protein HslJ